MVQLLLDRLPPPPVALTVPEGTPEALRLSVPEAEKEALWEADLDLDPELVRELEPVKLAVAQALAVGHWLTVAELEKLELPETLWLPVAELLRLLLTEALML